jgi:hypothetical protein
MYGGAGGKNSPLTAGIQRPSSTFTMRRRFTSRRFVRMDVRGNLAVDPVFASPKCKPTTPTVRKQLGTSKPLTGTSTSFVAKPVTDSPRSLDSQPSEVTGVTYEPREPSPFRAARMSPIAETASTDGFLNRRLAPIISIRHLHR